MFNDIIYPQFLLAIAGGLLGLLGSVGIFISLIVQRRLERLQDILEEFINLSYRSETNLTGQMYNLIEKYQMQFLFPQQPQLMILRYIDVNIFIILLLWTWTLFLYFVPPLTFFSSLFLIPLAVGIYAVLFFRRLLRNTLNLENPFLDAIIPAPARLCSISYLSHFVNISVQSVLKQARLTLFLKYTGDPAPHSTVAVYLKEELSFDDFFFYLLLEEDQVPRFISFGEILCHFSPDPITQKPAPVRRNVNIPLGNFRRSILKGNVTAKFLVFTRGEKHPIQYCFRFLTGTTFLSSQSHPEITVNHQITYCIEENKIKILDHDQNLSGLETFAPHFHLQGERFFLDLTSEAYPEPTDIKTCPEDIFID